MPNPSAQHCKTKILRRVIKLAGLFAGILLLSALLGWLALPLVPLPKTLFQPPLAQADFVDRHGIPLRAIQAQDHPFSRPVTYAEIPRTLVQATLAAEDKRFWRHPGVDWRGSLRAAWDLVRHRRIVSGGSTITQQLIKLAQPRPRTFRTKLIEAAQALRLEQVWDKQRILAEYLNRVDYGNQNSGCAAAAEFYCGKPLRDLSAAECALLAGLPQAPSRLNPIKHWERARKRQQWILERMLEVGFLTREEYERARAESLRMENPRRAFAAPHFIDLLLQQTAIPVRSAECGVRSVPMDRDFAALSGLWCGMAELEARDQKAPRTTHHAPRTTHHVTRTTLDLALNHFAEQSIRHHLIRLQPHRVSNAAAVIIDNHTGGVLALVGSENYFAPQAGQVNGAWAPRSAGSTFKPFTYLIAFEQGTTPASVVADVPSEFATATGLFSPVNYDRHCHGPVRCRLALANSLNIAAVKVLALAGGPAVLQARLQACGLTTLTETPEHYGLGLTIGNAEARLLELANAYACLARLGEYRPYTLVEPTEAPSRTQVFDPAASYLIADILSDNAARTLAFGAESSLRFDFPVACKTGTSSDFRDNWAFGYTPEFTVGVWVGNFDGSPMQGISGVTGAAPILHDVVEHLHLRYGTSWYAKPEGIVELPVHPVTGRRLANPAAETRPGWVMEKFIADKLPEEETRDDYDVQGRIRLPAQYRDWFASSDNWLAGQAVVDEQAAALQILFPLPGTTFFLDPDLPDRGSRIRLRVEGALQPEWHSDTLQFSSEQGQTVALLKKGQHRLKVRDPQTGQTSETWIKVLER